MTFGQEGVKSLIVAELDRNRDEEQLQHLVSYNFIDGELNNKDTLSSSPTKEMRWDVGFNEIFNNRYALSFGGPLINLKDNKVLAKIAHRFVAYKKDTFFFEKIGSDCLAYFDYELGEFTVDSNRQFPREMDSYSQNLTKGVEVDYSVIPRRIFLYTQRDKKLLIPDAGNGPPLKDISSSFPKIPIKWLNNDTLFYVRFFDTRTFDFDKYDFDVIVSRDSVLKKETNEFVELYLPTKMEVYKVVVSTGTQQLMLYRENIPRGIMNPRFEVGKSGEFILLAKVGAFNYNEMTDKFEEVRYNSLGNGFTFESDDALNSDIFYKNTKVGNHKCACYNAKTCAEFIALEYRDDSSQLGKTKGVKVWNSISGQWTTIDIPWIFDIIGWIEK